MTGRPSCITSKCGKHALSVLRYKFGSVYFFVCFLVPPINQFLIIIGNVHSEVFVG